MDYLLLKTRQMHKLGNLYGEEFGTGFAWNVWDPEYLCPAIMTSQGGGRTPMVIVDDKYFDCDR